MSKTATKKTMGSDLVKGLKRFPGVFRGHKMGTLARNGSSETANL